MVAGSILHRCNSTCACKLTCGAANEARCDRGLRNGVSAVRWWVAAAACQRQFWREDLVRSGCQITHRLSACRHSVSPANFRYSRYLHSAAVRGGSAMTSLANCGFVTEQFRDCAPFVLGVHSGGFGVRPSRVHLLVLSPKGNEIRDPFRDRGPAACVTSHCKDIQR
jgi:hypothetical protein